MDYWNFYFGSKAFYNTYFSLVEIYPENRTEPFYYYEVRTYDKSFTDKGIIDYSSRVTIDQSMDLVWIDMRYGPNANSVRFFNLGDKPSISQIIDIPFNYDIYTDFYSKERKDLLTYCTYDDKGDLIVKIVDIFNINGFSHTIDREIANFCSPQFLNDEEVYIEYEVHELEGRKLVKEIVNFKDNVTLYYKEEIIQ